MNPGKNIKKYIVSLKFKYSHIISNLLLGLIFFSLIAKIVENTNDLSKLLSNFLLYSSLIIAICSLCTSLYIFIFLTVKKRSLYDEKKMTLLKKELNLMIYREKSPLLLYAHDISLPVFSNLKIILYIETPYNDNMAISFKVINKRKEKKIVIIPENDFPFIGLYVIRKARVICSPIIPCINFYKIFNESGRILIVENNKISHIDLSKFSTKNSLKTSNIVFQFPEDYYDYKKYQFGDKINRIIWRVFFKNSELMSRKPEDAILDKKQLLIYVSLHLPDNYNFNKFQLNLLLRSYFLAIISQLQSLFDQEYRIMYCDETTKTTEVKNMEHFKILLYSSHWQSHTSVSQFCKKTGNPRNKSRIVIFSLFNHSGPFPSHIELQQVNVFTNLTMIESNTRFRLKNIFLKTKTAKRNKKEKRLIRSLRKRIKYGEYR